MALRRFVVCAWTKPGHRPAARFGVTPEGLAESGHLGPVWGLEPAAAIDGQPAPLTYPLPLCTAEQILASLTHSALARRGIWPAPRLVQRLAWRRRIRAVLRREGLPAKRWDFPEGLLQPQDGFEAGGSTADLAQAAALLAGRQLTGAEWDRAVGAGGLPVHRADRALAALVAGGRAECRAAIGRTRYGVYCCRRCGTTGEIALFPCQRCSRPACAACLACESLGRVRECDVWMAAPALPLAAPAEPIHPALEVTLTAAQRDASRALAQLVQDGLARRSRQQANHDPSQPSERPDPGLSGERSLEGALSAQKPDCLVWAACGAGKTEVAFAAVAAALRASGRVLFAIPRRDVVIELAERLRQAFPQCEARALYGGSPDRFGPADRLTIATTHQALRFFRCFDLVILDEADAFPYRDSPLLQRALAQSRTPAGYTVYMTATPEVDWLAAARQGQMERVMIPARHHGHPLPVPAIWLDRAFTRRGGPLQALPADRIAAEAAHGPLLVFVPAIAAVDPVVAALRPAFSGGVAGTHSRDPDRERKRELLAAGKLQALVTTTVLERGVTIEGVHTTVLFADESWIFDSRTLVQIAGRVGRSARRPTGRVLFCAARRTPAMAEAIRQIEMLNETAWQAGYLTTRLEAP